MTFLPQEGKGRAEGVSLSNGKFSLRMLPGRYRVQITATRQTGIDPAMNLPRHEQYIPARYNHNTALTADILPDRSNRLAFVLTREAGLALKGTQ